MTPPLLPNPEEQPLVDIWPTAARALGISRSTAYQLAREDNLPVEVMRVGGTVKVRTADLRAWLGLEPYPS